MKAVRDKETYYYKYKYEDWTQPVLTSNGTIGGDSFATTGTVTNASYQPYMVFNNGVWIAQVSQPTFIFYNPKPLKVTNIRVTNTAEFAYTYAVTAGNILGSNDNSTWNTIKSFTNSNTAGGGVWDIDLSSNAIYYKYYKIEITSHTNDWGGFALLNVTAKEENIIEGTEQDYDFYKDVYIYKIIKQNDIYKAPRSWEKGQYYGN